MSATRSRSVPAALNSDRTSTEPESDNTPFPSLPQEETTDARVPSWIQELATARAGRHSRASSIVSTRTRFSTTTFDDARSIDIQAGGQSFRISRFGDRITDTTAPPPYTGPHSDSFLSQPPEFYPGEAVSDERERSRLFHAQHEYRHRGRGGRRHPRRVRIAMPDQDETAHDDDSPSADTPSREITDEELRQIILDLPARLKTALGITSGSLEHDAGTTSITPKSAGPRSPHEVSNDGGRPIQEMPEAGHDDKPASGHQLRSILRNAPDHPPYHTDAVFSDREEVGREVSEADASRVHDKAHSAGQSSASPPAEAHKDRLPKPFSVDEPDEPDGDVIPPTVGDLNELSQVYNKVIRDLDREHRRQLHSRDKEMDQLRILLHEKDIVYRQQLRGKDFVIEDLKQRLDGFEEVMESRLERARNEVEDLWEIRWREHQKQLMEKCGLIKPALQHYVERAVQTDE